MLTRLLASLALIFTFSVFVPSISQSQTTVLAHPDGMKLTVDKTYNMQDVFDMLMCISAGYYPVLSNPQRAIEAYYNGEIKLMKISNPGWDFAIIYKGECIIIAVGDMHY